MYICEQCGKEVYEPLAQVDFALGLVVLNG